MINEDIIEPTLTAYFDRFYFIEPLPRFLRNSINLAMDILSSCKLRHIDPTVKQRKCLENITKKFEFYTDAGEIFYKEEYRNFIQLYQKVYGILKAQPHKDLEGKNCKRFMTSGLNTIKKKERRLIHVCYPALINNIIYSLKYLEKDGLETEEMKVKAKQFKIKYWEIVDNLKDKASKTNE